MHYNATTGRIIGLYRDDIHKVIPEPYIIVSDEIRDDFLNNQGNRVVDIATGAIIAGIPIIELSLDMKITILDSEYQPQFSELSLALNMAMLSGNTDLIASVKEDYAVLKAEYDTKRGEIIG